ncbi:MAG: phosphoribosylglycinamide formyltransferase [Deltaproteobacteria bacterium]|nr:MAG: phosphoribosylglycinamide formyltransferase [Deltaproteobacteria bacterium]TNF25651.1 MAG: phosphoribosylglycinamide formyltransferase [Deltaproteobacteria bacterium]
MKVCIMASGGGTNAENIIQYAPKVGIEIVGLISDQPEAFALKRAANNDIEAVCLPFVRDHSRTYAEDKEIHETAIYEWMKERQVDWIFLAGYMRILTSSFIEKFEEPSAGHSRIVNIHPSLLPSFPGKDAYKQAWSSGVKMSGATVHFVDSGVDTGAPIVQDCFPRLEKDSLEDFVDRGLKIEYKLYKQAMDILSKGEFSLVDIPGSDKKYVSIKEKA